MMKKIIPVVYLLAGLAFVAQGTGFLPLNMTIQRWIPMVTGWLLILLGVIMAVKTGSIKTKKTTGKQAEKEVAPLEEQENTVEGQG